jgi:hypothetical protein
VLEVWTCCLFLFISPQQRRTCWDFWAGPLSPWESAHQMITLHQKPNNTTEQRFVFQQIPGQVNHTSHPSRWSTLFWSLEKQEPHRRNSFVWAPDAKDLPNKQQRTLVGT